MIVLGIESTAHTFGAGVVKDGKVISNVRDAFTTIKGGIRPFEAADHHVLCAKIVIEKALSNANISLGDIDAVAFSRSPGLAPCLYIGAIIARTLALRLNKPLIGVNHCVAHLEIGRALGAVDPVLAYISGANTQIIAFDGGKYRIFGETLDIGAGNFLDIFARALGVGFPGGPIVEHFALSGKNFIFLPYSVKGMDVSFGGILTNLKLKISSKKFAVEDLCFSAQETVFAMLLEVTERALAHTEKSELVLGGGVCCNARLQSMARFLCEERNIRCFIPPKDLLVDNGAMIAYQGYQQFLAGASLPIKNSAIDPYERTDDVEVFWR